MAVSICIIPRHWQRSRWKVGTRECAVASSGLSESCSSPTGHPIAYGDSALPDLPTSTCLHVAHFAKYFDPPYLIASFMCCATSAVDAARSCPPQNAGTPAPPHSVMASIV